MIIREPLLCAHLASINQTADESVQLDWGLADKEAIIIYGVTLGGTVLNSGTGTEQWAIVLVNQPAAAVESWRAVVAGLVELKSPVLAVLIILSEEVTPAGKDDQAFVSPTDFLPNGYLTQRGMSIILDEMRGAGTLDWTVEIRYKRVTLTADEQTTLTAVRNR